MTDSQWRLVNRPLHRCIWNYQRIVNLVLHNRLFPNHVFIWYILWLSRYLLPKEDIALYKKKKHTKNSKQIFNYKRCFAKFDESGSVSLHKNFFSNVETVFWTLLSFPSEDIFFHLFLPISTWCLSQRRDQVKAT